jgi:SAM-dependent methyltransferase
VSLAKRGYDITAIELGANLALVARRELSKYAKVHVITCDYENTDLTAESFDLIYAATSFHWIRPEVRFAKSHALLKPGGYLAIIKTNHVSDEQGDNFFFESQPIYTKYEPSGSHGENFRLPLTSELKAEEIDTKLFNLVYFSSFPLSVLYSAKEYVELLATFSSTISMEPQERGEFLEGIRDIIDGRFGDLF